MCSCTDGAVARQAQVSLTFCQLAGALGLKGDVQIRAVVPQAVPERVTLVLEGDSFPEVIVGEVEPLPVSWQSVVEKGGRNHGN